MKIKPYVRKAQFYETDQMGIIHHANYVHWMEEARIDFMEQVDYGYERATQVGIDFVLTGISCDYKSMVRFGDMVSIACKITALNPILMTVTYVMTDAKTGQVRCLAESRHCTYDSNKKRPANLLKALPELYEILKQHFEDTSGEEA